MAGRLDSAPGLRESCRFRWSGVITALPRGIKEKLGKAQPNEALRRICLYPVGKIRVTTDRALVSAQRTYEGADLWLIVTRANPFYAEYADDLMDYELIVEPHE